MTITTKNEIVSVVSEAMSKKDLSKQAVVVVEKAATKVLQRTQQNIAAGLEEDAESVVKGLVKVLTDRLMITSQSWYDTVSRDLLVYPRGTRFIHRTAACQRLIIEQDPQVRTLNFAKNLTGGESKHNFDRFRLSLPYCIFMLQFTNNVLDSSVWYLGWRQKPLTSMDDRLLIPALPNTDRLKICMGGDFTATMGTALQGKNLTEQVDYFISTYWSGIYCNEWVGDYNEQIRNNTTMMGSPARWAESSNTDPLFVLKARFTESIRLRELIEVANTAPASSREAGQAPPPDLRTQLRVEITAAVKQLGEQVRKWLAQINVMSENKPKIHVETVNEVIREIVVQSYAELWEFCQKRLDGERKVLHTEMKAALQIEMDNLSKLLWEAQAKPRTVGDKYDRDKIKDAYNVKAKSPKKVW